MAVFFKKITQKNISVFTHQLGLLLKSKVPLALALKAIHDENLVPALKPVLEDLMQSVQSGSMLSTGMQRYPTVFDNVYINIIKVGEQTGSLDTVLLELANYKKKIMDMKRKVISAAIYPCIVLFVLACVFTVVLLFVLPKFSDMFNALLSNGSIPELTQNMITIGHWFQGNFIWLLGGGFLIVLLPIIFRKNPKVEALFLKIPIARKLLIKLFLSQFAQTTSILLRSGFTVYDAMLISKNTIANARLLKSVERLSDRLLAGESLNLAFSEDKLFPSYLVSMVSLGEQTNNLPEMLDSVASMYTEDINYITQNIIKLIEPVLILFLALLVGIVVFALFLPVMTLIEQLMV